MIGQRAQMGAGRREHRLLHIVVRRAPAPDVVVVLPGGRAVDRDRALIAGLVGDDRKAVARADRCIADRIGQLEREQLGQDRGKGELVGPAVIGQDVVVVGLEHRGGIAHRSLVLGHAAELQDRQGLVIQDRKRRAGRLNGAGHTGRIVDDAVPSALRPQGVRHDLEPLAQGGERKQRKVGRSKQQDAQDEQPAHQGAQPGQTAQLEAFRLAQELFAFFGRTRKRHKVFLFRHRQCLLSHYSSVAQFENGSVNKT